jgi:hypothetical protein
MIARASASVMAGGGRTDGGAGIGGGADAAKALATAAQNANADVSKIRDGFMMEHFPEGSSQMCTKSLRGKSSGGRYAAQKTGSFFAPCLLNGAAPKLFPRTEKRVCRGAARALAQFAVSTVMLLKGGCGDEEL